MAFIVTQSSWVRLRMYVLHIGNTRVMEMKRGSSEVWAWFSRTHCCWTDSEQPVMNLSTSVESDVVSVIDEKVAAMSRSLEQNEK